MPKLRHDEVFRRNAENPQYGKVTKDTKTETWCLTSVFVVFVAFPYFEVRLSKHHFDNTVHGGKITRWRSFANTAARYGGLATQEVRPAQIFFAFYALFLDRHSRRLPDDVFCGYFSA